MTQCGWGLTAGVAQGTGWKVWGQKVQGWRNRSLQMVLGLGSVWSEGCVHGCVPVGGRGAVQRETEGRGDGKFWNDTINVPCSRRRETLIVQTACRYVAIVSG